jgi:predicted metalloendopeptidase
MMFNSDGLFEHLDNNEAQNIFDNKLKCLTQQYKNFIEEKIGSISNPTLTNKTIDEIISDQGGLQIAEITFENWLKNNDVKDQKLTGLEYYNDPFQLFYISQTLPWCSLNFNDTYHLKDKVRKSGHHPIHEFRVRGPLSNSLKFAETWNCSVKSTMNPQEKCQIW